MGRQASALDITMIVFGVLMLILTISLFGIAGKIATSGPYNVFNMAEFGIGCWYLLVSVLAIVSGVTGHKAPYVAVIVLAIIAIFIALAGTVLVALSTFTGLLSSSILSTRYGSYSSYTLNDYDDLKTRVIEAVAGLPYGLIVINSLSFIFMIVISCVACCGTCCNSNANIPNQGATVVVSHQQAPGYVSQYPPSAYNQGYDQGAMAMNSYKQ